jgi:cobalamin biosynthesis Mg chelatase CobN
VAVKHVTETPPSACEKNSALPRSIEHVLYKVLAKNRTMRYQTAVELAEALHDAIEKPEAVSLLSMEGMTKTEPSLNKALEEEAARRRAQEESARLVLHQPVPSPGSAREAQSSSGRSPVFVPSVSPASQVSKAYSGSLIPVSPRTRKRRTALPAWTTWIIVALLVGGVLLSVAVGGAYVLLISDAETPGPDDYGATAIFKLTATKQAINGVNDLTESPEQLPILTPTPTAPPTNTPRAVD